MTDRFKRCYGIKGTVLKWPISKSTAFQQCIVVNGSLSKPFLLPWGVPQGSVMGPLEYILYTGPLCEIISTHPDIQYAVYADDTQLYITMSPNKYNESLQKLSQCISDIMAWSSFNKLKLNQSKTEILHITSQFRNSGDLPSLDIAGVDVISCKNVRDLGVIIDDKLNMQQHIRKTCRQLLSASLKLVKYVNFLIGNRLSE